MNDQLEEFARTTLKEGLAKCTDAQHRVFKLLYSHLDLSKPIDDVVDAMPVGKLDWAMKQVSATLEKVQHG